MLGEKRSSEHVYVANEDVGESARKSPRHENTSGLSSLVYGDSLRACESRSQFLSPSTVSSERTQFQSEETTYHDFYVNDTAIRSLDHQVSGLHQNESSTIDSANNTIFDGPEDKLYESLNLSPTTTSEKSQEIEPNTCFGMIVLDDFKVKSDSFPDTSSHYADVLLKPSHPMFVVRTPDDSTYIGLIPSSVSRVLARLDHEYKSDFSAVLERRSEAAKRQKILSYRYSLCIHVFGQAESADQIGRVLADSSLFLQHPLPEQSSFRYINPHILMRSNTAPESSLSNRDTDTFATTENGPIDRKLKSEVMQIFDSAQGPQAFQEAQISDRLSTQLKSHQKKALAMMVEKESGRLEGAKFNPMWEVINLENGRRRYRNVVTRSITPQRPSIPLGGLLADDMGLGKTLSVLALVATSIDRRHIIQSRGLESAYLDDEENHNKTTLIVTTRPTNDYNQDLFTWEDQLQSHFRPGTMRYMLYYGSVDLDTDIRLSDTDVVITTYEKLVSELNRSSNTSTLYSQRWFRVVLDEAHFIRNHKSQRHYAACALEALHRWCVTGTPLQNRIEDFGSLLIFLRAYPFRNAQVFKSEISDPIKNASDHGYEKLRRLIISISLRRTKSHLNDVRLPARTDRLHDIEFSPKEQTSYNLLRKYAKHRLTNVGNSKKHVTLLSIITRLRRFCNHGIDSLPYIMRKKLCDETLTDEDLEKLFESDSCENCGFIGQAYQLLHCSHVVCQICITKDTNDILDTVVCPACVDVRNDDFSALGTQPLDSIDKKGDSSANSSAKVSALLENLRIEQKMLKTGPSKSIVFSTWTKTLDFVERALAKTSIRYVRIDGNKTINQIRAALNGFRSNPQSTVLIASLGTAGVGLDLTAACNVHLLEPHWNPTVEEQALDRVHRLGQVCNVTTHRYVVRQSIEEYIVQVQRRKLEMIQRSLSLDNDDTKMITEGIGNYI